MGYTVGRRLTKCFLKKEALKYSTRSEFQSKDPSCYTTARKIGILDEICKHMKKKYFSTPQLMCRTIFNKLFDLECFYNTRKVIAPFELDLYYQEIKFAVEYQGKGWHSKPDVIERDIKKEQLCKENGITLLVIKENHRRYEEDIKYQICDNLHVINDVAKRKITQGEILDLPVSYAELFVDVIEVIDVQEIENKVKMCNTINEFKNKYLLDYDRLKKTRMLYLLNPLRKRTWTASIIIDQCLKINNYHDFVMNKRLYLACRKIGMLAEATKHMIRTKHSNYQKSELIAIAKKYKTRGEFKKMNSSAYTKSRRLGILDELFDPAMKNKSKVKVTEEVIYTLAKTCKSRSEFKRKFVYAYTKARKLKMLDLLFIKKGKYAQKN